MAQPRGAGEANSEPWWLVGAQATAIGQTHTGVPGPYFNPELSFGPDPTPGWSLTVTLAGGVTPWKGGMLVLMPEYANGRGMPNASGLGAYPNGDIVRVPQLGKAPYVARAFVHQDFPLGPELSDEKPEFEARFIPSAVHPLGGGHYLKRLELTVGKFALNDFLDVSELGSDPRHHFMSWGLMDQGAWDYAADTRGYTVGAIGALETPGLALRGGVAMMPTVANGRDLDWDLAHSRSEVVEAELRYRAWGWPGAAKLLLYINHAHMGRYEDALAAGSPPDITSVEKVGAIKYGAGMLFDQQLGDTARAFLRFGANDGQTETFAFTEIDQSASVGADVAGARWGRPEDRLALGIELGGLSGAHARYLAAGGHGFQLGDGALSYGLESVAEIYYVLQLASVFSATFDVQGILNPGMNAARGPVAVFGLRLHAHD